ncbi:MAG: DUF1853 family protein [Saprospiraceae bacterium]
MIKAKYLGFLNTPPLWEKQQFDIQQFEFPNLKLQSFQPTTIPGNIRLGHQVEYIFKQLLEYTEAYNVLIYNLPIRQEKNTLGEIDFILKDKSSNQLIHVELTYKFYLINPGIPEPIHSLIGPNRRDTFFLKMEKIKNKQFPLLHSPAGIKALHDQNINHLKIEHQCCFKAQLFQLYGSKVINIGSLNKKCLAGYWLRFNDFNQAEFANAQFYLPTKSEWIIEPNDQVVWKSHIEIMMEINSRFLKKIAPMIWLKNTKGEIEKLFVVWW